MKAVLSGFAPHETGTSKRPIEFITVWTMLLDGLVTVAEFDSRFEADLAAERLASSGIEATVVSDPAHRTYPLVAQPGHLVAVAEIDGQAAANVLADDDQQAASPVTTRGVRARPRWFRWLTYALALSVLIPVVGGVVTLLRDLISAGAI